MSEIQLTINEPAREWTVFTDRKNFSVQLRAWYNHDHWGWNLYALIFDTHPLHQNVEAALDLPFHYGATYNKRIVTSPAQGIRYNFDRVSDVLKVGNDYAHYQDDWAMTSDPKDGIPGRIQEDAIMLAETLSAFMTQEQPA